MVQQDARGSVLLSPARVVTEAQPEHDTDPGLCALLARAAGSPTVRRHRPRRTACARTTSYPQVAAEQLDALTPGLAPC